MLAVSFLLPLGLLLAVDARPAPMLAVDAGGDGALPCPAGTRLLAALKRQLPATMVTDGAVSGSDDLAVVLRHGPGGWTLRVARPGGAVVFERTLDLRQENCSAIAETCALIVERFLAEIAWRGRASAITRLPPASERTGETTPGVRLTRNRVTLAVGPTAHVGVPLSGGAGLSLEVAARLPRAWRAAVFAFASTVEEARVMIEGEERGVMRTRLFVAGLSSGRCALWLASDLCVAGLAGVSGLDGDTTGERLFQNRNNVVFAPIVGGMVRAGRTLPWGFEISTELAVLTSLTRPAVAVEGSDTARRLSDVQALFSLRLGWGAGSIVF